MLEKRELTRRELQELIGLGQCAISIALKQLVKYGEIEIDRSKGVPVYRLNIKKKKRGKFSSP